MNSVVATKKMSQLLPKTKKTMWKNSNKKSGKKLRWQVREERLCWLLKKMQPFIEAVQKREHFIRVPENSSQLTEIIKKYPDDTCVKFRAYNGCSKCLITCPCCSRICKNHLQLMQNHPPNDPRSGLIPFIKEVRLRKVTFMVSRCFFPPEIDNYNNLIGEELIAAYNLQHNIKLLLLGKFKQPKIPCSWTEFIDIHNEFRQRQQTVHISRMCRALAPLHPHTLVLYEIFKRILPEKMTRLEIVSCIEKVMSIYRKNHQNKIDLQSFIALKIHNMTRQER